MSFDDILTDIKNQLNDFLHSDWLGSLLIIIFVLVVTALCSRALKVFLERILRSDKGIVPQASIFINIGRIVIWSIGICVILSSCFGINVQAAVTALGIGGIAISLGFQSTLSNLIGGLQIILAGIIEPGDRIKISTYEGVVHDVTWRHTAIVDPEGETVIVPNSLINSSALQKLHPQKDVRIPILIKADVGVDGVVPDLESAIDDAMQEIASLKQSTMIDVMEKERDGFEAIATCVISEGVTDAQIDEAVSKALGDKAEIISGKTIEAADDRPEQLSQKKALFSAIIPRKTKREATMTGQSNNPGNASGS